MACEGQSYAEKVLLTVSREGGLICFTKPWYTETAQIPESLVIFVAVINGADMAFALGRQRHFLRKEALAKQCALLVVTASPVLQNRCQRKPGKLCTKIYSAAPTGLVGSSNEDHIADEVGPICPFDLALAGV